MLDQSVLSTLQRGGEGQNAIKEISNPCDQGCSSTKSFQNGLSTKQTTKNTSQQKNEVHFTQPKIRFIPFPMRAVDKSYLHMLKIKGLHVMF